MSTDKQYFMCFIMLSDKSFLLIHYGKNGSFYSNR